MKLSLLVQAWRGRTPWGGNEMYDRGRADGYKLCADELEAELAASGTEPVPYIDALTRAQAAAELYPHPAMEQRVPFIDGFLAALGFTR